MASDATDAKANHGPVLEQRVDKWLWYARVVKSRTMAAGLVTSGKVRVNRAKIDKPAHALKVGDVITVAVGRNVRVLKVLAPGVRRGPASEAQALFDELSPARNSQVSGTVASSAPGRHKGQPSLPSVERDAGLGRPTKRDRRLIDQLRGRR